MHLAIMSHASRGAETKKPFVLYVNNDKLVNTRMCPGSQLCLDLISGRDDVLVQRVDALVSAGVVIPVWLNGTPCLVDRGTSRAFKGTAAVTRAREISYAIVHTPPPPALQANRDGSRPPTRDTRQRLPSPDGVAPNGTAPGNGEGSLSEAFQTLSPEDAGDDPNVSSKITSDELEKYMRRRGENGQAPAPLK